MCIKYLIQLQTHRMRSLIISKIIPKLCLRFYLRLVARFFVLDFVLTELEFPILPCFFKVDAIFNASRNVLPGFSL